MLSLDKENTTGSTTTSGKSKLTESNACASSATVPTASAQTTSNLVATPKNNATNKLLMTGNTTGKRRALGDVANTTNWQAPSLMMGITPKVDRTVLARQLANESIKPSSIIKKLVMPKNVEDAADLEPVERFIGSKCDTFDDLFPEGRLSEMLLNGGKKVNFVVRLPMSGKRRDRSPLSLKPIRAKEKCEPHKKMKKIMNKMEMQETLVELELPPLDEPEPLIELLDELTIF